MIKVERLVKTFGTTKAVDDISLEVAEGETLVLLGTSGCGKTTTLKMLNRLIEPDSGTIYINGRDVLKQSPEELRRGIGYVLQNNGLFPHYTVAENIAIVPNLLKWDKEKTEKLTAEIIEKLHLTADQLKVYPNQLSGGQQQRVGLARALIANPAVLLMDEPFGALDNVTRKKIHEEFKALDELKRKTIVMVTHDVQEAFELADRIALMDKGKIIQAGSPAELLFRPANDFVSGFLRQERLQLEFRTITLQDVWAYLPLDGTQKNTSGLSATSSIWQALESFKFQPGEGLNIIDQRNTEIKTITFNGLMSAYSQYKTLPRYE